MIQQALAAIVTQLSVMRPLVLLLENWQWSDEGSREIVRQLGALVPGFRVLLVVTYRPEYSEDWSRMPHQWCWMRRSRAASALSVMSFTCRLIRSWPSRS